MTMGIALTVLIDTDKVEDEEFIEKLMDAAEGAMEEVLDEDVDFVAHLHDIDLDGDLHRVEFDLLPEATDEELSEEE